MGQSIMHYRAQMIGGTLSVRNHEDGGNCVVCGEAENSLEAVAVIEEFLPDLALVLFARAMGLS